MLLFPYFTVPVVGLYMPLIQLNIEVLPAPFGPIIEYSFFGLTSKLMSFNAVIPPNFNVTFSNFKDSMTTTFSFSCNALHL